MDKLVTGTDSFKEKIFNTNDPSVRKTKIVCTLG
jgi:hypothetical protein